MIPDLIKNISRLVVDTILPSTVYCDSKFGNKIPWRKSLSDALEYGKLDYRPVMVVIWMDGCPSCMDLIPKVAASKEIAEMITQEFSAIALNEFRDDVERFRVDGGYTPRIYFMSPKGEVDSRFYNKHDGDPEYKFHYSSVEGVLSSMKEVVEAYPDRCMPTRPCKIHHFKNNHPLAK